MIHDVDEPPAQVHPSSVVTVAVPGPPAAANEVRSGETVAEQMIPACETAMTVPATVKTPVRASVAVFGAMV